MELFLVGQILKTAAATAPEMRAGGGSSGWRRADNRNEAGSMDFLPAGMIGNFYPIARIGSGYLIGHSVCCFNQSQTFRQKKTGDFIYQALFKKLSDQLT